MDTIVLSLGLGIVITIIIGGIFFILSQAPREQNASTKAIEGTDFFPSQMFMGSDGLGGLAVNEHTQQLCLFTSPSSSPRIFPIADLVGSYLIKNGEILGKSKRSYPKEIVTYETGLHRKKKSLIHSLHMDSSSEGNQRIDLFIAVQDLEDPLLVVNFLDMETEEGGAFFEKAKSTATHWQSVLDGLILEADRMAKPQSKATKEKEMAEAAP
jgi:hypothetical protein